jgi:Domain of unknown function (DUF1841)
MKASNGGLIGRLSLIASEEALASVAAGVEDLADPDVRAVAIRADHPELDRAPRNGEDELVVDGEPMSIRLHLTMHQVLANQLADDDPPEVYLTARRLLAAGYERHEVLHMLAAPIAEQIHATLQAGAGIRPRPASGRARRAAGIMGAATWPTNPEARRPPRPPRGKTASASLTRCRGLSDVQGAPADQGAPVRGTRVRGTGKAAGVAMHEGHASFALWDRTGNRAVALLLRSPLHPIASRRLASSR